MRYVPVVLILLAAACNSPEAHRKRGGGAGADPGNRKAVVELHAGAQPYHDTPCRLDVEKCPKQSDRALEEPDSAHE